MVTREDDGLPKISRQEELHNGGKLGALDNSQDMTLRQDCQRSGLGVKAHVPAFVWQNLEQIVLFTFRNSLPVCSNFAEPSQMVTQFAHVVVRISSPAICVAVWADWGDVAAYG